MFAQNHPGLLKEKFFVKVPGIKCFICSFMKLFLAAKTIKKFHPMRNGGNLHLEFPDNRVKCLSEKLPADYGSKGGELKLGAKEPVTHFGSGGPQYGSPLA